MALRLYLDDSADSRNLQRLLVGTGYHVTVPADVGLAGAHDEVHYAFARQHGRVVVTKNPRDFRRLQEQAGLEGGPGILAIYQDNNVAKDMTDQEVVRAIDNLVAAGVPFAGQAHVLNQWRY